MNDYALITVASWEPRFWLGFQRLVSTQCPEEVCLFYYSEYEKYSAQSREEVLNWCGKNDVSVHEHTLSFSDYLTSWKTLQLTASALNLAGKNVVIDITTMPRETIWILLGLLDGVAKEITWVYNKPEKYNSDWPSRDPGRPRLVPKMGGIAKLGLPTNLLVLGGFDIERTKQLVFFYEPEVTLLGLQSGVQFDNQKLNVARHQQELRIGPATRLFEVDAYASDQGLASIDGELRDQQSNLIMTSLGPKPSAIALYNLTKLYPQTGLAYAPSREYNLDYSSGIGETIVGRL